MLAFFLFFIQGDSFSHQSAYLKSKKNYSNGNFIDRSQENLYSREGYYSILLHDKDSLHFDFHNGSFRLFFFMPDLDYFILKELIIDGESVDSLQFRGFVIEGKNNAILRFKAYKPKLSIQSDFWFIRNSFCPNPVVYLYGSEIMNFGTSSSTRLCVFSPSFDSKNNNYEFHFGITKEFGARSSKLYTTNFDQPNIENKGTEAIDYKIDHASFIQYRSQYYLNKVPESKTISEPKSKLLSFISKNFLEKKSFLSDVSDSFIYTRKTKIKYKSKPSKCDVIFALRCKSSGCNSDYLREFYWGCESGIPKSFITCFFVCIIIFIIFIIVLICFCVKARNPKDSYHQNLLNDQNDKFNSMPSISYTESPYDDQGYLSNDLQKYQDPQNDQ